jgi:hypothetical protein
MFEHEIATARCVAEERANFCKCLRIDWTALDFARAAARALDPAAFQLDLLQAL